MILTCPQLVVPSLGFSYSVSSPYRLSNSAGNPLPAPAPTNVIDTWVRHRIFWKINVPSLREDSFINKEFTDWRSPTGKRGWCGFQRKDGSATRCQSQNR